MTEFQEIMKQQKRIRAGNGEGCKRMTDQQKDIAQHMREWYEAFRRHGKGDERSVKVFLEAADLIEKLSAQLVNQATEYSQALKITTEQRDAAIADLNMCCPCEVCTRSCTYDKVNPYDECADFEWRGVKNDAE